MTFTSEHNYYLHLTGKGAKVWIDQEKNTNSSGVGICVLFSEMGFNWHIILILH